MGSGVAKQIRDQFPQAYRSYMAFIEDQLKGGNSREDLLGMIDICVTNGKVIGNMFGQLNYGYDGKVYTDTMALYECFKRIRIIAEVSNLSVALPYGVGCYRGGTDWQEVESLLMKAFKDYDVTLYKYHEGK
jgi:hypothetical protein